MVRPEQGQPIRRRSGVSKISYVILAVVFVSVFATVMNHWNIVVNTTVFDDSIFTINLDTLINSVIPGADSRSEIQNADEDDENNDAKEEDDKSEMKRNYEKEIIKPDPSKDENKSKNTTVKKKENDKIIDTKDEYNKDETLKVKKADEPKENVKGSKSKRMNVVLLYPDDWRHDSIGSEKPYVLTPFLNDLADEGIRFTQNAVTTSVCWMSRATLWMGQYTSRHKSYKLKCPRFASAENWKHSWIKILQNEGYFIGHVGKWQYFTKNTRDLFDWSRIFENHHWERKRGKLYHATDLSKEYAFDFLKERPKDKPFALTIAFYPPKPVGDGVKPGEQWSPTNETRHLYDNITIPEPEMNESFKKLPKFLQRGTPRGRFTKRYSTSEHYQASMKNYYALITGVDQACKEIIDKLKEDGLYNNTMVIFTTDNGMFHGSHGLAGKWLPYQESIRVPLIIYDPRMPADKVGTLDDSFTLNVDLAQTILGAAGTKPDDLMQGRDISDLYLPNEKSEYHNTASVESEPWREEFFYEFPGSIEEYYLPSSTAFVRKGWKFMNWPAYDRVQLFNLKDDPLELNDLYDNKAATSMLDEMKKGHDRLKSELHDPSYVNDTKSCHDFKEFYWKS